MSRSPELSSYRIQYTQMDDKAHASSTAEKCKLRSEIAMRHAKAPPYPEQLDGCSDSRILSDQIINHPPRRPCCKISGHHSHAPLIIVFSKACCSQSRVEPRSKYTFFLDADHKVDSPNNTRSNDAA